MFASDRALKAQHQASGQVCDDLSAGLWPVVTRVTGLELLLDNDAGIAVHGRKERLLRVNAQILEVGTDQTLGAMCLDAPSLSRNRLEAHSAGSSTTSSADR